MSQLAMSLEEFSKLYMKPAADQLWDDVINGRPITQFEVDLIHSLGPESASWALKVKDGPSK